MIDYKTGRPRSAAALKEDLQLSLYAVAAREAWQLDASEQSYLYVLDDRKVRVPSAQIDALARRLLDVRLPHRLPGERALIHTHVRFGQETRLTGRPTSAALRARAPSSVQTAVRRR